MQNATIIDLGDLDDLKEGAKVFVKEQLKATGAEVSFGVLAAKTAVPFLHTHKQNEEIYIIIKGKGQFRVDDDSFEVKAGSVVRVAPAGKRGLENTGAEPLPYIVIQAKEGSLEQWTMTDGVVVE